MTVAEVFKQCVASTRAGELIVRESQRDKEFHFQNWFKRRLDELQINVDESGRNSYPDYCLVNSTDGFELKGLAYPGREADYDCNSQIPRGEHNGRTIYYVFGRYPDKPDGNRFPLLDLVVCHGSFLNADSFYKHKNKNFRGMGSYGDIMVRDRKMYVAPTPFALADGTAHHRTLILPINQDPGRDFVCVGELLRREVDEIVIAYQFDLKSNVLTKNTEPNPSAGREHRFKAWRLDGDPTGSVSLRSRARVLDELQEAVSELDADD